MLPKAVTRVGLLATFDSPSDTDDSGDDGTHDDDGVVSIIMIIMLFSL